MFYPADLQISPLTQELLASQYPNLPLIKTTPPSPGYGDSQQIGTVSSNVSAECSAKSGSKPR